jgi:uncharacterized repeat protein (TIGR03847 family)
VSRSFELSPADRITVGTVGEPGARVFYLQARMGGQVVTLKMEKGQVGTLARSLGELLENLPRVGHLPDDLELEEPVESEWTVGAMSLGYDEEADHLVMVAEEFVPLDPDGDPIGSGAVARFTLTREQAAALAIRGTALVEAGRPPCPLCGFPLDPSGHTCPRTNGNRPPTL